MNQQMICSEAYRCGSACDCKNAHEQTGYCGQLCQHHHGMVGAHCIPLSEYKALRQNAQEWVVYSPATAAVPCEKESPSDNRAVLLVYQDQDEKEHTIRAQYIHACTVRSDADDSIYSAEHDEYYLAEGWYESTIFTPDRGRVVGTPIAWKELPRYERPRT